MVVRSSFVTNSSSSSFVCLSIDSQEMKNILTEFADELEEVFEFGGIQFLEDNQVSLYFPDTDTDFPQKPEDIAHVMAGLFGYGYYDDWCCAQEDGEDVDLDDYSPIVRAIVESKDEILANLKEFRLTSGSQGWQGDDESRFDEGWYTPELLASIKAEIAAEKGCEIDEITAEDFCEHVCDRISSEEHICTYNPETREFTETREVELL